MNHKTIQNHKRHADKAPLEESPSSSWPGPAANDCSKALVGGWGQWCTCNCALCWERSRSIPSRRWINWSRNWLIKWIQQETKKLSRWINRLSQLQSKQLLFPVKKNVLYQKQVRGLFESRFCRSVLACFRWLGLCQRDDRQWLIKGQAPGERTRARVLPHHNTKNNLGAHRRPLFLKAHSTCLSKDASKAKRRETAGGR